MVKDAEANKEADKKKREGVDARNQADSIVFSTEKSLKEHGDKITADEKKNIESGISDLKEALKGTDVEEIKKENSKFDSSFNETWGGSLQKSAEDSAKQ